MFKENSKERLKYPLMSVETNWKIEELKDQYPLITNDDYWMDIGEKIDAQGKFHQLAELLAGRFNNQEPEKSLIHPAYRKRLFNLGNKIMEAGESQTDEFLSGYLHVSEREVIQARNYLRGRKFLWYGLLDRKDGQYKDLKLDDVNDVYFYLPQSVKDDLSPEAGEALSDTEAQRNFFAASNLGVPVIFSGTLVIGGESGLRKFNQNTDGFYLTPESFKSEENILSHTGLPVAMPKDNAKLVSIARHEAVHLADGLRKYRVLKDDLIAEFIAYLIDGRFDQPHKRKKHEDSFQRFVAGDIEYYYKKAEDFLSNHLIKCGMQRSVKQPDILRKQTARIIKSLESLRELPSMTFDKIIQLLLNSVSIDEFEQAANQFK